MSEFDHAEVEVNGITVHYVSQGDGPLVVFCHGFTESWYSWRHQLPAVADAGFTAIALDMRGYGGTSKPERIGDYALGYLIGDVVGVVNALGAREAVVVGHDWGALVAWYAALMRPDVFRAVAVLSVPYMAPTPAPPEGTSVTDLMRTGCGQERDFYRLYFQEPGVAEADLEADVARFLLGFLYTLSGDIVTDGVRDRCWDGYFPMGQSITDQLVTPVALPAWLTEDDVKFYVGELSRNGLRGPVNWYRNINALPAFLAPFVGTTIRQPSCYLGGERDLIAGNTPGAIKRMQAALPDLRRLELLSGAGHWLQQERPTEVNAALTEFLLGLGAP